MNKSFQLNQKQAGLRITQRQISYPQFKSRYRIGQELGKGAFGKVHKIYGIRSKKERVIKQITLKPDQIFDNVFTQVAFQISLAHPLVVKVFEFYCLNHDRQRASPPILGIVMQLGNRTLLDYIKDPYQNFNISQFLNFSYSFIRLFAHFQDNNIVHRDIKPANFIQFGQGLNFKLTDFGLCCRIDKLPNYGGTRQYLSPNLKKILFKGQKLHKQTNSFKDDVYSLGVTLYEMITRKVGTGYIGTFKQVQGEIYRCTKSVQIAEMINLMLAHQEKNRPDFIQLFNLFQKHWIKSMNPPQPLQRPQFFQCDVQTEQSKMGLDLDYQQNQNYSNVQDIVFNTPENSQLYQQKDHISIVFNSQPRFPDKLEVSEKVEESSIFEKTQNFHKKQQVQIPVFDTPPTLKNDSPKQKIQQKQQNFQKWSMDLNRDLKITSIQKIQNNLIIGSSNGKMFLVKLNDYSILNIYEIVGMKKMSKNSVNIIQKDSQQNLWIPNHDGTISIWNRSKLLQSISDQSCIRLQNSSKKKSIFNRKIQTSQLKFFFPEQVITQISLPNYLPSTQISTILPFSQSKFIIGYCDGFIQIKYQYQQLIYKLHSQSITSINLHENMLYTSSLDGFVRIFEMDKFIQSEKNMRTEDNQPIVKNIIIDKQLYVFTLNGKVHQITLANNMICKTLQNQVVQDVLSAVNYKKNVFSLSSQGLLMKNGKNIDTISHNQGWSNMLADQKQNFIFLVNKKDKITILKFNQQ